jgi:hypothetical protein
VGAANRSNDQPLDRLDDFNLDRASKCDDLMGGEAVRAEAELRPRFDRGGTLDGQRCRSAIALTTACRQYNNHNIVTYEQGPLMTLSWPRGVL